MRKALHTWIEWLFFFCSTVRFNQDWLWQSLCFFFPKKSSVWFKSQLFSGPFKDIHGHVPAPLLPCLGCRHLAQTSVSSSEVPSALNWSFKKTFPPHYFPYFSSCCRRSFHNTDPGFSVCTVTRRSRMTSCWLNLREKKITIFGVVLIRANKEI